MNDAERIAIGRLALGVWGDFRRGFRHFLAYDLCFKVLGAAVVAPIAGWATAALFSGGGRLSVSNAELVSFWLSPTGLTALFVSGAVALTLLFAEQVGLIAMSARAITGGRVSTIEALRITVRKLPSLVGLGALQAVLLGLALAPLGGLAGLAYMLLPLRHDINYYLAARPAVYWVGVGIIAVLLAGAALVFLLLYLRWIFSVPAMLFEGAGPLSALRTSRRLMHGQWRRVAGVLATWALVMLAVPFAATGAFDLTAKTLLGRLGGSVGLVVAGVVVLVSAYVLVMELVTLTGLSVNSLLVTRFYRRVGGELGGSEPGPPLLAADGSGRARRRGSRLAVAGMVVSVMVFAAVLTLAAISRIEFDRPVGVTAHRGSSGRAPENMLSAIEAAIEDGADYTEIDVQETADGVVVVLHDEDLMRIARVDRKIWEISYAELRELDAGSWFAPEFAGERVPTLQEAIEVARGRIKLNIELKFNGHDEYLAERVVRILEEERFTDDALVSSLDLAGLATVRNLNPSLRTGYMIYGARGNVARLDVDFLSLSDRLITRDRVASIQQAGKEVHVWTVDGRRRMSSLIDLGVDNITTNVPARLRAVIDERAALSDAEKLLLAFGNWLRR
jgi:glycerophosphoryl diester phosphodiesterase